jgi:hypothetical protein
VKNKQQQRKAYEGQKNHDKAFGFFSAKSLRKRIQTKYPSIKAGLI